MSKSLRKSSFIGTGRDAVEALDGEKRIGRIYRGTYRVVKKWMWFSRLRPHPHGKRVVDSLDEAKAEITEAYERYKGSVERSC
jgi:hypothetical protein